MRDLTKLTNNELLHMVTTETLEATKELDPARAEALLELGALRTEILSRMKPGPPKTEKVAYETLKADDRFIGEASGTEYVVKEGKEGLVAEHQVPEFVHFDPRSTVLKIVE